MQTLELVAGSHIDDVAHQLVAKAPARGVFNKIPIRARYATTNPADIVREYHWRLTLQGITWRNSPAGKAVLAEAAALAAKAQAAMRAALDRLPSLDMTDSAAVLAWIEDVSEPVGHVDVQYNHDAVKARFEAAGWLAGANTHEAFFDGADPRNFAGWIVGQWLKCRAPIAKMFVGQWRERFAPVTP